MKGLQRVCLFIILSALIFTAVPEAACSTTTQTGLTGNQSISVSDAASYDINITNHHVYVIGNDTFTHRKLLTVNNSSAALTDYQILKNITYDSDMQSNFGDLRFTTPDGTNVSFWIQDQVDGSYVNVWLKVPSISTTTGAEIWMYYGGHDSAVYATRYVSNPILSKSTVNPSWDYSFVNSPFIAVYTNGTPYIDGDGNYYMYYSGSGNSDGYVTNQDRIGLALSTDLYNWTRCDPVIAPLDSSHAGLVLDFTSGAFDSDDVQIGTIIVKDGTFHMWYTGNDNSGSDNLKFGYATSSDGKNWTKSASNPIMSYGSSGDDDDDGMYSPHVILDGDTWKMWYLGRSVSGGAVNKIMYATAPVATPAVWTKYSTTSIYTHNTVNSGMFGSYVYKENGTYTMLYTNYDGTPYEIWSATSPDGIAWTKQSIVFNAGASGEWDDSYMFWPNQIYANDQWYTFYRGNDAVPVPGQIGVFTCPDRLPTDNQLVSTSSINDTMVFGDDFDDRNDGDLNGQGSWNGSTNFDVQSAVSVQGKAISNTDGTTTSIEQAVSLTSGIISIHMREDAVGGGPSVRLRNAAGNEFMVYMSNTVFKYRNSTGGVPDLPTNTSYTYGDFSKIEFAFDTINDKYPFININGTLKGSNVDAQALGTVTIVRMDHGDNTADDTYYDEIYIRKYTATEPTWAADGAEQNWSLTNITASVTGDSNTQEYNTTQLRNFTLTPTGTTNYVNVTTESTDYNITITTTSGTDTTDPAYSGATHSTTETGTACTFSIQYNDDTALHTNGQYIFSTNNSGAWVNESVVNFTATPQTIETIKTLNSTSGVTVGYRWYASDNAGNTADTSIYTLETTETQVVTYVNVAALVTGTVLTVTTDMTGATFSTTGDSVWDYEKGIDLFTGVGGLIVLAIILIVVSTVVLGMRGEMQIEKLIGISMGILVLVVIFPMIVMTGAQIEEVSDAGDGSTATLTITDVPSAGQTLEINTETFTLTDGTAGAYLVDIGSSPNTTYVASQIVDSINTYSSVVSAT